MPTRTNTPLASYRLVRFGVFELNLSARLLTYKGQRIRLQEQPLRILESLLEKPAELVTREDLRQRLWPSDVNVDFEAGLNAAMKKLRLALGDASDNPRFIETVPKQGYRFIAPVQRIAEAPYVESTGTENGQLQLAEPSVRSSLPPVAEQERPAARRMKKLAFLAVALGTLAIAYWFRPLMPFPKVSRIRQLTTAGKASRSENLFSDGARLYYHEHVPQGISLRQVLLNGNENTAVETVPLNFLVKGLSPDHTTFLALAPWVGDSLAPIEVVPVLGAVPRRVGNLLGYDASWSPDGSSLVFARGGQLFLAKFDNAEARLLASPPGWAGIPRWSPDGTLIRFTLSDETGFQSLWEVGADGHNLHRLRLNLPGDPPVCCGQWTPDGRYFVVASRQEGIANLWLVQEKSDWLHRVDRHALQLTVGPINYYHPLPSQDGKTIFAVGTHSWGELLRYDVERKDFAPFFGGQSVDHLNFTPDGQWVTYVVYPEATLWRARSDGSQSLQLTFPPFRVGGPRWSPDGKRIVFAARRAGEWARVYTISSDGGNPEPVLAESHSQTYPTWSTSGDAVIFGRDADAEPRSEMALFRRRFATGVTEKIPASDGLYSPSLSPDGRYLAGVDSDSRILFVIDLHTGRRTQVSKHTADYPCWSPDSRYLYYNTLMRTDGRFLLRVRVPGGDEEVIASVAFMPTGVYGFWSGLAPDGSPILLRDLSQTNIYSLSLSAP